MGVRFRQWMGMPIRIRDQRGAERELVSFKQRWADLQQRSDLSEAEFAAIRKRVFGRAGGPMDSVGCLVVMLVCVVVGYTAPTLHQALTTRAGWLQVFMPLCWTGLLVFVVLTQRHRLPRYAPPAVVIEELLRIGRCASCAQDLRAIAAESDGCTVCPECGAAWRLPTER